MIFRGSTWAGRVASMSRDDGRHAERRGRTGRTAEMSADRSRPARCRRAAQHLDLGREDAVRVDGALGDAGAAAGEEDGGRLVGARSRPGGNASVAAECRGPDRSVQPPQPRRGPTVTQSADAVGGPSRTGAGQMRLRDADERLRLGLAADRRRDFACPCRDRSTTTTAPTLNRANVNAKNLQARRHHQHGARCRGRCRCVPGRGEAVALRVQFAVGVMPIADASVAVAAERLSDGERLGPIRGHGRQVGRNVPGDSRTHGRRGGGRFGYRSERYHSKSARFGERGASAP